MKISVSSYSFQQDIRAGKMTQFDCVSKAKEIGFDAIEFTDLLAKDLEEQKEMAGKIREEADRVGIEINAYTIMGCLYKDTREEMDKEIERLKGQLKVAQILGVKLVRHDAFGGLGKTGNARSFDLMLPTVAENTRKVTEYAQTLGIKTCSENHGYLAQDSDRMERFFNAVNHDNFGLLVDMGNFICVDENPATAVSRLAPYAVHVHAKDMIVREEPFTGYKMMTRGGNYLVSVAIGEGDVPVEKCLRILKRVGYDGYLSLEYDWTGDCVEVVTKGLKNLKKYIANVEM